MKRDGLSLTDGTFQLPERAEERRPLLRVIPSLGETERASHGKGESND